jgi:hypothetical protein
MVTPSFKRSVANTESNVTLRLKVLREESIHGTLGDRRQDRQDVCVIGASAGEPNPWIGGLGSYMGHRPIASTLATGSGAQPRMYTCCRRVDLPSCLELEISGPSLYRDRSALIEEHRQNPHSAHVGESLDSLRRRSMSGNWPQCPISKHCHDGKRA